MAKRKIRAAEVLADTVWTAVMQSVDTDPPSGVALSFILGGCRETGSIEAGWGYKLSMLRASGESE